MMSDAKDRTSEVDACCRCGRRVEGELEGIRLSICCLRCCRKFRRDPNGLCAGMHRVSKQRARKRPWSEEALWNLNSCEYYGGNLRGRVNPLTLYVGAEVYASTARLIQFNFYCPQPKAAAARQLESLFGIVLEDHSSYLCAIAARGCLFRRNVPSSNMEAAEERFSVLDRVEAMYRACPEANPEVLFDFCLQYPNGDLPEFLQLKEKVTRVFQLEGDRIMGFLSKKERQMLMGTAIEDVALSFKKPDRRPEICAYLSKWCGEDVALEILAHPGSQLIIQRCQKEMKTAQALFVFWETKDDFELREAKLRDALLDERNDLDTLGTSERRFCDFYIKAEVDCDPEEIVAAIKVIRASYGKKDQFREQRIPIALTVFEDRFIEQGLPLNECVDEAIEAACKVHLTILANEDGWDYQQLTRGYWTQIYF